MTHTQQQAERLSAEQTEAAERPQRAQHIIYSIFYSI